MRKPSNNGVGYIIDLAEITIPLGVNRVSRGKICATVAGLAIHTEQKSKSGSPPSEPLPAAIICRSFMAQPHQLSYCVWINATSIPYEFPELLSKGGNHQTNGYGGYEFVLNMNGDSDLLFVSGPFQVDSGGGLINPNLGQWIHIAFTIDLDAQTAQFYVNGQPVDTHVASGAFTDVNFNVPNPRVFDDLHFDVNGPEFSRRSLIMEIGKTQIDDLKILWQRTFAVRCIPDLLSIGAQRLIHNPLRITDSHCPIQVCILSTKGDFNAVNFPIIRNDFTSQVAERLIMGHWRTARNAVRKIQSKGN